MSNTVNPGYEGLPPDIAVNLQLMDLERANQILKDALGAILQAHAGCLYVPTATFEKAKCNADDFWICQHDDEPVIRIWRGEEDGRSTFET